jgi:hypothetical protein
MKDSMIHANPLFFTMARNIPSTRKKKTRRKLNTRALA